MSGYVCHGMLCVRVDVVPGMVFSLFWYCFSYLTHLALIRAAKAVREVRRVSTEFGIRLSSSSSSNDDDTSIAIDFPLIMSRLRRFRAVI